MYYSSSVLTLFILLFSVNELLAIILMAYKFGIPVCPHAGGVGLCELAQHISFFDYIAISGTMENRVLEYVEHLHEHFLQPVIMKGQNYIPPSTPGYLVGMHNASRKEYAFPAGPVWEGIRNATNAA